MNIETATRVLEKLNWEIRKQERFLNYVTKIQQMRDRDTILKDACWIDGTLPTQVQYAIRKRLKLITISEKIRKRYLS